MSGVKVLTYLKKMDRTILRAMVVAFCHHLNMDRSGYPQTPSTVMPDVFSRVVRIADIYDALTSARSYRMKPFSRAEALAIITEKAGKELDPTLCAVFADVVGGLPDNIDPHEVDDFGVPGDVANLGKNLAAVSEAKPDQWDFPSEDAIDQAGEDDAEEGFDPADTLPEDSGETSAQQPD